MKKGLSILLIAAALFGFYGSAVNLNDILACKDYWEKAGEESTANMNKLEDGLNQLKENEQAYLDGKDQVADGEKALAAGEEQYAQGLADYEAAPAKLADGEKQIAEGEAKLADGYAQYNKGVKDLAAGKKAAKVGEKQLADLNTLIDGINQVVDGYPQFKNGYKKLRDGRTEDVLKKVPQLAPTLEKVQTLLTEAKNTDALGKLGAASQTLQTQAAKTGFTNKDYDDFDAALKNLKDALNACSPVLAAIDAKVLGIKDGVVSDGMTLEQIQGMLNTDNAELGPKAVYAQVAAQMAQAGITDEAAIKAQYAKTIASMTEEEIAGAGQQMKQQIVEKVQGFAEANGAELQTLVKNFDEDELTTVGSIVQKINGGNPADVATAIGDLRSVLGNVHTAIGGFQTMITGYTAEKTGKLSQWIDGYAQITSKETASGQKKLVGGVAQIIGGVLASKNDELINGMNAAAKKAGFKPTDYIPVANSQLAKDMASDAKLENFYNDMNKIEAGFKAVLPALNNKAKTGASDLAAGKKAIKEGEKKLADARKQLAQGEKDLAAGKAQLAQGKADYAAAPGKLADAEKQLAEGRQALADGKAQLAQYEDGEQQVRDGLATLAGTEADLSLKSILDRLNGDDDFDNGDNHLELDEGLAAVEVGRGYQAEDGVLITDEIMARAVGTGALLGAGALAVLAAILSFLKKNKGAGVFAILAAAAGAFGAFYGTNAGTYFSDIAGSTAGSAAWVAAGILGAVALVHAIVHFTAKEA